MAIIFFVHPIDLLHLAQNDKLIAIATNGTIIVKTVRKLGVTTNHVSWLQHRASHRIVNSTACVNDFFLSMIHHHHSFRNSLAYYRSSSYGSINVERFYPIIINNIDFFSILLTDPNYWTTS